jgi:tRNA (guanine-N7-)-methyltransferase
MSPERLAYEAGRQATRDALKAKCAALFPEACVLTLEIGCGHGHFLAAYATSHPEEHCVGIDLITERVVKGNKKGDRQGLGNLLFLKAEALEFLDALPAHVTIERTFILFPDPWPKKRHWRHRFVQQPLLNKLAARMAPGSEICLRTDHKGYFAWMEAQVAQSPHWKADPSAPWPFEAPSFFQSLMESWQSLVAVRVRE